MVCGVEFDGFGEMLNSLLVSLRLEGFVSFILELEGLLVAHKLIIILERSI